MSETRSHISDGNILHIAEVAVRRKHNRWRVIIVALLLVPVLIGLVDILSRFATFWYTARAAPQLEVVEEILAIAPTAEIRELQAATSSKESGSASQTQTQATFGIVPVQIQIPSIGVDAHVQKVGINAAGAMQAPSNFTDVGWYQAGSKPGEPGSAVFSGHVNNALTKAGVFEHLAQIRAGDTVTVSDTTDRTRVFRVQSIKIYPADSAPVAEIFSRAGPSQLVLITCDGVWDAVKRQFSDRLVVYAGLDT